MVLIRFLLFSTAASIPLAPKGCEFHKAIDQQAKPEVDYGAQIDFPGAMLCRRGKMG
jgi:hypothetical protein